MQVHCLAAAERFLDLKGVVAVAALLLSAITAYWTWLKGARLRVQLGDVVLLRYALERRAWIAPELSMFNGGARVGVVSKVSATLASRSDRRKSELRWVSNMTSEYEAPSDVNPTGGPHTHFESFPTTIFVPGADWVVKRLELVSEHPFELVEGDYELTLDIRLEKRTAQTIAVSRTIRVRRQDELFLAGNIPIAGSGRTRNLRVSYDHSLKAYVSSLSPSTAPRP
jgi:hypothetical protein